MALTKSASPIGESVCQNYISVCGICLSAYEVPKALPCLHSFCLQCLREWASATQHKMGDILGNKKVSCPNCRKKCVVPDTGVDGLPTNFFITERNQVEKPPKCNSCRKADREIVARCHECGFVYQECLFGHKSMRALEEHALIELDKLRTRKTVKQFGKLWIRDPKGNRRLGSCMFRLEKTVDLKSIDSNYNAVCCSISADDKIAVPTYNCHAKAVYIFEKNGNQKLEIDHPSYLGHPSSATNVAFDSNGNFYITDCESWVKVHNSEGKFNHSFQIYDIDGERCTEGRARGIVINSKQQIIVVDSNTINIYRPDESYINSFRLDSNQLFIASSSSRDTLLVTNTNEMVEVDYSGKVLNTITSPIKSMAWEPAGVCCSKYGEIFVVNAAKHKCCVCRFTISWQFTGCVITDLENPRGIAISEDGEVLAVVDTRFKLKLFHRS